MKKKILYITILVITGITNCAFIYGQTGSMLEKLQGKTWRLQSRDGSFEDVKYTRRGMILLPRGANTEGRPFYLSDRIETKFDRNKVGKVENGKYIVKKGLEGERGREVFNFEIVKLDDKELVMKERDYIWTYRALEVITLKYVLDNTPTGMLPFTAERGTELLTSYNFPITNKTIPDRLYQNVQLTKYTTNTTETRGGSFSASFY